MRPTLLTHSIITSIDPGSQSRERPVHHLVYRALRRREVANHSKCCADYGTCEDSRGFLALSRMLLVFIDCRTRVFDLIAG